MQISAKIWKAFSRYVIDKNQLIRQFSISRHIKDSKSYNLESFVKLYLDEFICNFVQFIDFINTNSVAKRSISRLNCERD